jgi:phosphomevalonate kinase
MTLVTKAPGKVMIAGEYSVLFGGKAIIAAHARKAICQFSPIGNSLQFVFHIQKKPIKQNDHPLFIAALNACSNAGFKPHKGHYLLDSKRFFDGNNRKLGLGSSAAAITALCQIILKQHDVVDRHLLFQIAYQAHRNFSSGLGSGADIAASTYQGVITFQHKPYGHQIKSISFFSCWDKFLLIDIKRSQNTRNFIEQVLVFKKLQENFITNFCERSSKLCLDLIKKADEFSTTKELIDEAFYLLKNLGEKADIDIVSKEHQEIHKVANKFKGTAKPSGAGGGDIALALIPPKNHRQFKEEIKRLKFSVI